MRDCETNKETWRERKTDRVMWRRRKILLPLLFLSFPVIALMSFQPHLLLLTTLRLSLLFSLLPSLQFFSIFFLLSHYCPPLQSFAVILSFSQTLSLSFPTFFSFPKEERCEIVLNTWYTRLISFLESSTHLSIHPSFHP